jgi:two-component system response regulator
MAASFYIMMVEDNEADYHLLATACQAADQECYIDYEPTGEMALLALREAKEAGRLPAVIVIDLDLPGMTGYDVLRLVRGDAALREVAVVVLTGSSAPEDLAVCAAADRYLVKPADLAGWRDVALQIGELAGRRRDPEPARPRRRERVPHLLHIDDDRDDRELFARAFAQSGLGGVLHSVAGSADALLFLNRITPYADAVRPKLIILDLSLPHLDGRDLLELLKTNLQFKSIPVVVITGSESYADVRRCRELAVEDYVVKPRTHHELIELITSFEHWLTGSASNLPIE